MNKALEIHARAELIRQLMKCTDKQQLFFKRIYSHKNRNLSIQEFVENMPVDKLDWTVTQVERTLTKKREK